MTARTSEPRPEADERATSARALGLRIGLQFGVLIVTLLAVVGLIALWLYENEEHSAADETLRAAAAELTPGEVPPGFWVVVDDGTRRRASTGLPDGLPDEVDLAAVARDGRARQHEVEAGDRTYFVRTQARRDGVIQVAMDRTDAEDASGRMISALLLAGAAGVVLAAGVAVVLARRSLSPVTEALAMQRRFVSDASHELRTPLTLLSTRVQLLARRLERDPETSPEVRGDLAGVLEDTRALTDILDELLIAAEPGSAGQRVPCALADLAASCVASASASAVERGVELTVGKADPVVVQASEVAVRRAVTALVDNALDHARSRVVVDVAAGRGRAEVTVTDDGPGVPPDVARRMFERFASHRAEPQQAGTADARRHYGLGLALVSDVALAHGGRVELRSRADGAPGAALVLVLPR